MTMAIESIGAIDGAARLAGSPAGSPVARIDGPSFSDMLLNGIQGVDRKVADADHLVRQFAIDDTIPVHQVTIALEEARLGVELAMQVRARLVEAYRDLMTMQL